MLFLSVYTVIVVFILLTLVSTIIVNGGPVKTNTTADNFILGTAVNVLVLAALFTIFGWVPGVIVLTVSSLITFVRNVMSLVHNLTRTTGWGSMALSMAISAAVLVDLWSRV